LPGWPRPGPGFTGAAAEDLDGDGEAELASMGQPEAHLFSPSGAEKPGWPFVFPSPEARSNKDPTVGDVDGDGIGEVAIPISFDPSLYLFRVDGTIQPGFPLLLTPAGLKEGVSMADVNGDGAQELVFQEASGVWIVDGRGQPLPGFPAPRGVGNWAPAIGDLDADGHLEVAWGTPGGDAKVFVYRDDGTLQPGWPVIVPGVTFNTQATIGDVSGDGKPDVVLAGRVSSGFIFAWHADGTPVPGFPFLVPGMVSIEISSVTITDLDQDGDVDLLVGTVTFPGSPGSGRVFAFDLRRPYDPLTMEWPTLGHDIRHTSRYEVPVERVGMDVSLEPEVFSVEHPPAGVVARLVLPELDVPEETGFRVVRVGPRPVRPPLVGILVASPPAERGGPDRVVRFDGPALAAVLGQVAPSPTGLVEIEVESTRIGRRVLAGADALRTSPRPPGE
jgi:hypothetical protein